VENVHCQIFSPNAFGELFSVWERFPSAVISSGGTWLAINSNLAAAKFESGEHTRQNLNFPKHIISLASIEELKKISRTERYLEIGAAVKLNQIINLGKIVPEALSRCIKRIACPQVRNLATVGGNICTPFHSFDITVPMLALDAHYELRSAQSSRWVTAANFFELHNAPSKPDSGSTLASRKEILTRIRVPLEPWTFTWYRKFLSPISFESEGAFIFMMRNEKNILTDIRIVSSGKEFLRQAKTESFLLGKRLPLSRQIAETYVERWDNYLSDAWAKKTNLENGLAKMQIISSIKMVLKQISE
jgi:CO/xanthine dehydrogenase FAD-binding subunit